MRYAAAVLAVGLCLAVSSGVQAALVNGGTLNIATPAGNNVYGGGGIAFIPGGTDSIAQDTLVINWKVLDSGTNYNNIFQRITIPTGGGTPTVLATATLRWDHLYDGVNPVNSTATLDLAFDAANKKMVTTAVGTNGATRFVSFDLFNTDLTIGSVGYSKAHGDNTTHFGRVVTVTPDSKYQSFYYFSGLRKVAIDSSAMDGTVAVTKTTIPLASFGGGWYPNADGTPTTVNGFNCEGAVTYDDDNVLMLRSFRPTSTSPAETHLHMVGSALDAPAINGYTDLGNATVLNTGVSGLYGWGLTANPAAGVAFVRYGYLNASGSANKILMVSGLPAVPEPATLALLFGGFALMAARRRHA